MIQKNKGLTGNAFIAEIVGEFGRLRLLCEVYLYVEKQWLYTISQQHTHRVSYCAVASFLVTGVKINRYIFHRICNGSQKWDDELRG